jgi:hypothetical protein
MQASQLQIPLLGQNSLATLGLDLQQASAVRRMHQSLHHLVADAPWADEALLSQVRSRVLTARKNIGPVEEWLLIEWPREESEPTQYWVSTLPARTALKALVKLAKHRCVSRLTASWYPSETVFPLCPRGPTGATRPGDSTRLPTPRLVARGPSGIIQTPSQPSASGLPERCWTNSPVVLFVAPAILHNEGADSKRLLWQLATKILPC